MPVGPAPECGTQLPFVIVCPPTNAHGDLPVHVDIEPDATNGLDAVSFVQCELIRSVGRHRLVHRLGSLTTAQPFAVHVVVAILFDH